MRVIFYIFIISSLIVLSFVILMPSLFDVNSYRQKIQSIVYAKTGNTLEINGNISLSIFPMPSLKLEEIKYYKNQEDILFNSNKLVIVPEVISFIKGNIVFKSIKLIKPLVSIKLYSDNTNNWSNSLNYNSSEKVNVSNEDNKKKKITKNQKETNPFKIKSLVMREARLSFENNGQKHELKNLKLSLKYLEDNNYIIDGNFDYNSEKVYYSYNLADKSPLLYVKGIINNSTIKIYNETQLNIDTITGESKVYLNIEKMHDIYKSEYLKNFPLDIKTELNFSDNYIEFKKIVVTSKGANLNGQGSYKKSKDKKTIIVNIKSNHIDLNNYVLNKTTLNNEKGDIKRSDRNIKKESKSKVDEGIFMLLEDYNILAKIKSDSVKYNKIIAKGIDLSFNKKNIIKLNIGIENLFNGKIETDIKVYKNKKIDLHLDAYNIEMEQINSITGYNYITGNISLLANVTANLKNKKTFKKSLNGELLVKNKNTYLNNLNLDKLKKNILNIKEVSSIAEVKNGIFQGNTKIKNSKKSLIVNDGVLKLPNTNLQLDEGYIAVKGNYNIENNKININVKLNDHQKILLSLFTINFNGKINDISTKLDYDSRETEKVLNKNFKKEMKKIIKKKLDKKFNNVIENLLN